MLMGILVGRYGWKCFEDGFIFRGGGGCLYVINFINICILSLIN